jgi:hypothetical protein
MVERLGMADRVRLEEESDHIGVWPDAPGAPGAPGSRAAGAGQETAR